MFVETMKFLCLIFNGSVVLYGITLIILISGPSYSSKDEKRARRAIALSLILLFSIPVQLIIAWVITWI